MPRPWEIGMRMQAARAPERRNTYSPGTARMRPTLPDMYRTMAGGPGGPAPAAPPPGIFGPASVGRAGAAPLPYSLPRNEMGGVAMPWMPGSMSDVWQRRGQEAYGPGYQAPGSQAQDMQSEIGRLTGTTRSTLAKAAQLLGITPEQAYRMMQAGTLDQAMLDFAVGK